MDNFSSLSDLELLRMVRAEEPKYVLKHTVVRVPITLELPNNTTLTRTIELTLDTLIAALERHNENR